MQPQIPSPLQPPPIRRPVAATTSTATRIGAAEIVPLFGATENIRNVCVVAHVDHGKTSVSDALLASNGVIAARSAGQVRFLDARADEQERQITMLSRTHPLLFDACNDGSVRRFLVNLVDSPGHVDFGSQVCIAAKVADGALLLVDVVEGVCAQTRAVIRQLIANQLAAVLVLNKVDRLVTELRLTPQDAALHLARLVEQVNAVVGACLGTQSNAEWRFAPHRNNVVYASAVDGWAFCVDDFARFYAEKPAGERAFAALHSAVSRKMAAKRESQSSAPIAEEEAALKDAAKVRSEVRRILTCHLSTDAVYDAQSGRISAATSSSSNMFAMWVLTPIWQLYAHSLLAFDASKITRFCQNLQLNVATKEMAAAATGNKGSRSLLMSLMAQWLPIAPSLFRAIVAHVPDPTAGNLRRMRSFLAIDSQAECATGTKESAESAAFCDDLPSSSLQTEIQLPNSDVFSTKKEPFVCFVAKIVPCSTAPKKVEPLVDRRSRVATDVPQSPPLAAQLADLTLDVMRSKTPIDTAAVVDETPSLVGLCRVVSGSLRPGTEVFVVCPHADPFAATTTAASQNNCIITRTTLDAAFLLFGDDLQRIDTPLLAGNIVGIGGAAIRPIVKCALITDSEEVARRLTCPAATAALPVVSVAVEPVSVGHVAALEAGLRLLHRIDPLATVRLASDGQYTVEAAGELHLEQLVRDLTEFYARVPVTVSPPVVPFRETLVADAPSSPPCDLFTAEFDANSAAFNPQDRGVLRVTFGGGDGISFDVSATPMPVAVAQRLFAAASLLRPLLGAHSHASIDEVWACVAAAPRDLEKNDDDDGAVTKEAFLQLFADRHLLTLGPAHHEATNALCITEDVWARRLSSATVRELLLTLPHAFQMAAANGPLCGEPLFGVMFEVVAVCDEAPTETPSLSQPNQKLTAGFTRHLPLLRDAFKRAFLCRSPRLMQAIYACNVTNISSSLLGRVFAVIRQRAGRVTHQTFDEESFTHRIACTLPICESFGFAAELRSKTSGSVAAQVSFAGYEVLDAELQPLGNSSNSFDASSQCDGAEQAERRTAQSRAMCYVLTVRARKGLRVDRKIVEHAEKQSTLKK